MISVVTHQADTILGVMVDTKTLVMAAEAQEAAADTEISEDMKISVVMKPSVVVEKHQDMEILVTTEGMISEVQVAMETSADTVEDQQTLEVTNHSDTEILEATAQAVTSVDTLVVEAVTILAVLLAAILRVVMVAILVFLLRQWGDTSGKIKRSFTKPPIKSNYRLRSFTSHLNRF